MSNSNSNRKLVPEAQGALEKFKYDNVKRLSGNWYWNLSDTDEEVKTSHPIMDLVM